MGNSRNPHAYLDIQDLMNDAIGQDEEGGALVRCRSAGAARNLISRCNTFRTLWRRGMDGPSPYDRLRISLVDGMNVSIAIMKVTDFDVVGLKTGKPIHPLRSDDLFAAKPVSTDLDTDKWAAAQKPGEKLF